MVRVCWLLSAAFRPAFHQLTFLALLLWWSSPKLAILAAGPGFPGRSLSLAQTAEVGREQRQGNFPLAVRALNHCPHINLLRVGLSRGNCTGEMISVLANSHRSLESASSGSHSSHGPDYETNKHQKQRRQSTLRKLVFCPKDGEYLREAKLMFFRLLVCSLECYRSQP